MDGGARAEAAAVERDLEEEGLHSYSRMIPLLLPLLPLPPYFGILCKGEVLGNDYFLPICLPLPPSLCACIVSVTLAIVVARCGGGNVTVGLL